MNTFNWERYTEWYLDEAAAAGIDVVVLVSVLWVCESADLRNQSIRSVAAFLKLRDNDVDIAFDVLIENGVGVQKPPAGAVSLDEIDRIDLHFFEYYGQNLTEEGRKSVGYFLRSLSFEEVSGAAHVACKKFSENAGTAENAFRYFCGICHRKIRGDQPTVAIVKKVLIRPPSRQAEALPDPPDTLTTLQICEVIKQVMMYHVSGTEFVTARELTAACNLHKRGLIINPVVVKNLLEQEGSLGGDLSQPRVVAALLRLSSENFLEIIERFADDGTRLANHYRYRPIATTQPEPAVMLNISRETIINDDLLNAIEQVLGRRGAIAPDITATLTPG